MHSFRPVGGLACGRLQDYVQDGLERRAVISTWRRTVRPDRLRFPAAPNEVDLYQASFSRCQTLSQGYAKATLYFNTMIFRPFFFSLVGATFFLLLVRCSDRFWWETVVLTC